LLASYANFALSKSLSEPFMDYRKGTVRPADCVRAMSLLGRVKHAVITRYVRIQIIMAQMRCELRSEDWEAARKSLLQLRALAEDRPEYEAIIGRVKEFEAYLQRVN